MEKPVMDNLESILDHVATVGYDVDFLRGENLSILAANPIAKASGPEHFKPLSAPTGALAATGPWAARLLQGFGTFIDELAGETTWSGSLDLPAEARRVGNMVRGWMEVEVPLEAHLISSAGNTFPTEATIAEQFYSLRDAIHFSEQWLRTSASLRPAFTVLLAFCIGVDEFFCSVDSIDTTVFLGRQIGHLWDECLFECGGSDDAARWLGIARDALRSSVFLQNREKLAYIGLVEKDKEVFTDWNTTAHYMLRAETAMTPFCGFLVCAGSGLPFREDLVGAVGLYCYANAFVLDFCKRSTRLGGGNYTEIALDAHLNELQGRSHLIGTLLAYGEAVLPAIFISVLHPYVFETSSVVDVLDRYRERSWGQRLPLNQATLCMMKAVMEGAKASLGVPPPKAALPRYTEVAAEIIDAMSAWDAYDSYVARPSVETLYKLPRTVRLAFQPNRVQSGRDFEPVPEPAIPWLRCLGNAQPPPLPAMPVLTRLISPTSRLPSVSKIDTTGLSHIMVCSPARPGGYAAGYRDFIGRPAGAVHPPALV